MGPSQQQLPDQTAHSSRQHRQFSAQTLCSEDGGEDKFALTTFNDTEGLYGSRWMIRLVVTTHER